jgi:hypothetical protein
MRAGRILSLAAGSMRPATERSLIEVERVNTVDERVNFGERRFVRPLHGRNFRQSVDDFYEAALRRLPEGKGHQVKAGLTHMVVSTKKVGQISFRSGILAFPSADASAGLDDCYVLRESFLEKDAGGDRTAEVVACEGEHQLAEGRLRGDDSRQRLDKGMEDATAAGGLIEC